jgi:hypothetical protein
MSSFTQSRYITLTCVICLSMPVITQILGLSFYFPDMSSEYPRYSPDYVLIQQLGMAFLLIGLTILGMKAEEERQVLAAGGFTAQAISLGLASLGLFEITSVTNKETYEKFYYITVTSNFLYFPSQLLIATYSRFWRWLRIVGFIASIPLLISTILFMAKYRDFQVLEVISSIGYVCIFLVQLGWAWNIYVNYRNEVKTSQ